MFLYFQSIEFQDYVPIFFSAGCLEKLACQNGREFFCPQEECDGFEQCSDGSDEQDCTFSDKLPSPNELVLIQFITKSNALQSICNCRQSQIVPANVMTDNVWTTEINSAMEFQIVVMEVMNFDVWIVDMEFLSTWDAMANQIVLMSRMNFSVLL